MVSMRINSLVLVLSVLSITVLGFNPQKTTDVLNRYPGLRGDKEPCGDDMFFNLVRPLGYPAESHKAYTGDGYVLKLFRIQAKGTQMKSGKPAILLQHGIFDSADNWVVNGDHNSIGLFLADSGYDVWFSNTRGNKYSRENLHFSPNDNKFWDYSFQDMAQYDVPANIRHILSTTKQENLVYVGHSQGTTQMFAALTDPKTRDEINKKVKLFIALAPVVYLPHCTSKITRMIADNRFILSGLKTFGIHELMPGACSKTSKQSNFESFICKKVPAMCDVVVSIFDEDGHGNNKAKMPIYVRHSPSGSSLRTLLHFKQNLLQKNKENPEFRMYDFGSSRRNKEHYGQSQPPEYDLSQIKIPVRGFIGTEDKLGDPTDNQLLKRDLLKLGVDYQDFTFNKCGHMTFMWAYDASAIWNRVLEQLKQV